MGHHLPFPTPTEGLGQSAFRTTSSGLTLHSPQITILGRRVVKVGRWCGVARQEGGSPATPILRGRCAWIEQTAGQLRNGKLSLPDVIAYSGLPCV